MRRSKFRLLASFLEATMLSVHDSPIEFEVSIGMHVSSLSFYFYLYLSREIWNDGY